MSMKFTKLYRLILALAVVSTVSTQEADAQLLRRLISRTSSRVGSRAGSRAAARTTRELAEEMAEKSAIEWTESKLAKTGARTAADRTAEKALLVFQEEGVEKVMKEELDRLTREALENASKKGLKVTVAREISATGQESGRTTVQDHIIDLSEQAVRQKLRDALLRKLTKNEADRLFVSARTGTVVHEVDSILGQNAGQIWRETVGPARSTATERLVDDTRRDRNLCKTLQRNPELLKAYHRMGDSPYRKDVNLLRYFNYGAGKYGRAFPEIKNMWGLGDDLVIRTQNGTNYIYNASGTLLGSISGNAENGYVIQCSSRNRTLLNLYPLGNARYECDGISWTTDRFGRVIHAYTKRSGRSGSNVKRDVPLLRSVLALKSLTTASGDATAEGLSHLKDEAGHIIALSLGGTNDLINFVCQHVSLNRKVLFVAADEYFWHRSEESLVQALERGATIQREIFLHYDGLNSLRPDRFEVSQAIDRQYDRLPLEKKGRSVDVNRIRVDNP